MNKTYSELCLYLEALLPEEGFNRLSCGDCADISLLSNAAALLWEQLERLNWCGFYLANGDELVLGPFQGKTACIRIAKGRGVCGTAFERAETVLVPDVHRFPGHIACDAASNSEIVVPLIKDGAVIAVLDIDSPDLNRFDEEDREGLEAFAKVLLKGL